MLLNLKSHVLPGCLHFIQDQLFFETYVKNSYLALIWLVVYVVYLTIQTKLELNFNWYYQKPSYQWFVDIYFEKLPFEHLNYVSEWHFVRQEITFYKNILHHKNR